jgi:hypothetical protein
MKSLASNPAPISPHWARPKQPDRTPPTYLSRRHRRPSQRGGSSVARAGLNLANFIRTLALPEAVAQWSLTSLREKVVKIGAKVLRHARCAVFQMAEVAVPRELFKQMLRLIDGLRPPPAAA